MENNSLKISINFKVEGVVEHEFVTYSRGTETYAFNFEDFLRHAAIIEKFNPINSSYISDLIDKYCSYFNVNGEDKTEMIYRYVHKRSETFQNMISSYTEKGYNEIFETEKLFIQHQIHNLYYTFQHAPDELKRGFLLLLQKEGGSNYFSEQLSKCPDFMRDYVEEMIRGK